MENNQFFCYSNRLHAFLHALRFRYVSIGINKNTNKNYWVYEKSEDLNSAISLYNSLKYKYSC